jgi:hypothetical protein
VPYRWLQVKGDPSVRAFLFAQSRQESLFDTRIEAVHDIVRTLLAEKGAFHVKVHYSSSQLTCWFSDDAYRYRVYVREEVTDPGFTDRFPDRDVAHLKPLIDPGETPLILSEFRRLRLTDETLYLRNGSINLVNGMIGMTFSCDGAHYIDHRTFFDKLESFGKTDADA